MAETHHRAGPVSAAYDPYGPDGPEVRLVVGGDLVAFHPDEIPHILEVLRTLETSLRLDEQSVREYIEERRLGSGV